MNMEKNFEVSKDMFNSLLEEICYDNTEPYLTQVVYGIQQGVEEAENINELVDLAEELFIILRDFDMDEGIYTDVENLVYRLQEFID